MDRSLYHESEHHGSIDLGEFLFSPQYSVGGEQMRNRIIGSILLICLLVIGCSHAPKSPPLVLERNKYSYTFAVPEEWDFSFEQADEFYQRLVFFPAGGDIRNSNSVITVKEVRGNLTSAIERVMANAKKYNPDVTIETAPSIPTISGVPAQLRILTGSKYPRQAKEALAFIDHGETIVLVDLSTKNTVNWQNDYKAFETVVAGHRYFACNSPNLVVPCRSIN
jgi:hypothetical protein